MSKLVNIVYVQTRKYLDEICLWRVTLLWGHWNDGLYMGNHPYDRMSENGDGNR